MASNTVSQSSLSTMMADLDQTEICQLKTQVDGLQQDIASLRNHHEANTAKLTAYYETNITNLRNHYLTKMASIKQTLAHTSAAAAAKIRHLKDLDQAHISSLQAQLDELRATHAHQDKIQESKVRELEYELHHINGQLKDGRSPGLLSPGIAATKTGAMSPLSTKSAFSISPVTPLFSEAGDEYDMLAFGDLDNEDTVKDGEVSGSDSGFEGDGVYVA